MDETQLTAYLHDHIPLSRAMAVSVRKADIGNVILEAPLAPNINHRETLFGGSASAIAILAAWTLLFVRLQDEARECRVVIQRNSMAYKNPIAGTFTAVAIAPDADTWARFLKALDRRGRARIEVASELWSAGKRSGRLEGIFVALKNGHSAAGD
jgi:thioesterase domain-containing protein